jgi:hypothetical protein
MHFPVLFPFTKKINSLHLQNCTVQCGQSVADKSLNFFFNRLLENNWHQQEKT